MPSPTRPATERMATRMRAWLAHPIGALAAGAIAAALVVPTVVAAGSWIDRRSDAAVARLVDAYVAALLTGDAEGATAMAPPDATIASPALLTDEVLATTARLPIECAQPIIAGTQAHATCTIDAIPQPGWSISLALDADGWHITDGLAARVRFDDGPVTGVGGVTLPATTDVAVREVWLYPGTYRLDVVASPLLDADGAVLVVSGDVEVAGLGDAVTVDDAGVDLEQQAAEAYLAECASAHDADCPSVAPLEPDTTFVAVGVASTAVDAQTVQTTYLMQRRDDGVAVSTTPVIVTSTFDETFTSMSMVASEVDEQDAWLP